MQIDLQVLAAPPPAGHLPSVLTKSDVAQVDHAAWVVSRAGAVHQAAGSFGGDRVAMPGLAEQQGLRRGRALQNLCGVHAASVWRGLQEGWATLPSALLAPNPPRRRPLPTPLPPPPAVLYCGIVCIILAWGCACFCFVRHCCWLKRRRGAAAAAAEADAEAGGAAGAGEPPTDQEPPALAAPHVVSSCAGRPGRWWQGGGRSVQEAWWACCRAWQAVHAETQTVQLAAVAHPGALQPRHAACVPPPPASPCCPAAQAPTLKCPLPVVVVCPDNSWELGIKEDGLQAACDVAAAVPPPDKPHAPGGSASVPAPQRRYRVQLATAGVWLPADCAEADEGADGDATEGGSNIGCWYAGPAVHAGASSSSSSSSQHDSQAGSDRAGAGGAAQGDDGSCYSGGASGAARAGGEQPLRHGTSGHEASSVHGGSSTPAAPSHAA